MIYAAKLRFLFISIMLLSVMALSGCGAQTDEKSSTYNDAIQLMGKDSVSDYKQAALMFDELGDYKDAKVKSEVCWGNYAKGRFEIEEQGTYSPTKDDLTETRDAFIHANDDGKYDNYIDRLNKEITYLTAREDIGNGDYADALSLLEGLKDEKQAQDLIKSIQDKQSSSDALDQLGAYLEKTGHADYVIDKTKSLNGNLSQLFHTVTAFQNNPKSQADAIASLNCYDVLARSMNEMVFNKREIPYPTDNASPILDRDAVLLAMIQLANESDTSEDFAYLLTLLQDIAKNGNMTYDGSTAYYTILLNAYTPGPALFERCYPNEVDYKTPGTMDYALVNAPEVIKNALAEAPPDAMDMANKRFIRTYTRAESEDLFSDFKPEYPKDYGYIYIIGESNRPENLWGGPDASAYEGGKFFCASNPNNARIAIYEDYTYSYSGIYHEDGTGRAVEVYLPTVEITVVDLLNGATVLHGTQKASAKDTYTVGSVLEGMAYCPYNFFSRSDFLVNNLHVPLETQ